MTTAWHEMSRPADLAALVDAIADRSGCRLVVERFGQVLCHGAGAGGVPGLTGHAGALHVHVNTLRYRLRRAGEVSGLDLSQSRQRFAAQLLTAG